jgi:8-oxo-dGTP diphosphatase
MAGRTPTTPAVMHVMAGIMLDVDGLVLLAQRPAGKHLAGLWEFPGGKREPGESPCDALARELREELGIEIDPQHSAPHIQVPWRYGERALLLDAWLIRRWLGQPQSREGQALQWCLPAQIDARILTPADAPILQALNTYLASHS